MYIYTEFGTDYISVEYNISTCHNFLLLQFMTDMTFNLSLNHSIKL
jgi:hypothetical protein